MPAKVKTSGVTGEKTIFPRIAVFHNCYHYRQLHSLVSGEKLWDCGDCGDCGNCGNCGDCCPFLKKVDRLGK